MFYFRKGLVILSLLFLLLNGCAVALLGVGAVGAIAISRDEVSSYVDTNKSDLWQVARTVLAGMGEIKESDRDAGIIKATVKRAKITCVIEEVTDKTSKLRIKARKNLLPDVDLAHKIATKILKKLD